MGAPSLVANWMVRRIENQRIQTKNARGRHEEARSHARGALVLEARRRLRVARTATQKSSGPYASRLQGDHGLEHEGRRAHHVRQLGQS